MNNLIKHKFSIGDKVHYNIAGGSNLIITKQHTKSINGLPWYEAIALPNKSSVHCVCENEILEGFRKI